MVLDWTELAETLDLDAVLNELGMQPVAERKGGLQLDFHCPLPNHPGRDKRPSFGIHSEELVWNCFTCDEGGSLPRLIEIVVDGVDGWNEALEWLMPFSEYEPDSEVDPDLVKFRERVRKNLERAERPVQALQKPYLPIYSPSVFSFLEDATADQLQKWGIKDSEVIQRFGVKYDPEHERYGYTGPAIVIPHWFKGELVGYQERWLSEDRPKHVNKVTNSDNFPRSETIFNYDEEGDTGLVVEAALTAIRVKEVLGDQYVPVATFGASLSDLQISLMTRFSRILIAYDSDPPYRNKAGHWVIGAGVRAKMKLARALVDYMPVRLVPPTDKEKGDLADCTDEEIKSLVSQAEPYL